MNLWNWYEWHVLYYLWCANHLTFRTLCILNCQPLTLRDKLKKHSRPNYFVLLVRKLDITCQIIQFFCMYNNIMVVSKNSKLLHFYHILTIFVSKRTLRRFCQEEGIQRYDDDITFEQIAAAIQVYKCIGYFIWLNRILTLKSSISGIDWLPATGLLAGPNYPNGGCDIMT